MPYRENRVDATQDFSRMPFDQDFPDADDAHQ